MVGFGLFIVACSSDSSRGGEAGSSSGASSAGSGATAPQAGAPSVSGTGGGGSGGRSGESGSASNASGNSSGGNGAAGSSGAAGGTAGASAEQPHLPADAKVMKLDMSQKAIFCDWYADQLGGYGSIKECLTGSIRMFEDQAQCVASGLMYTCPILTVAQLAECTLAQVPSGGCERPAEHCHWLDCR